MWDDRLLPCAASLRTKCVQLLQYEAEKPHKQLRNADRLHRVHASAAKLFGGVCDSIGCDGERSSACRGRSGWVGKVTSRVRFFGEERKFGGGIAVEGGRAAEDSVVLSSESGWKEGSRGEKLAGREGKKGVCGVWRI